jgi:hypothetical protein
MDIRFGTLGLRVLYRLGSLTTVTRETAKYKLGLLRVEKVRCNMGGTEL